MIVLPVISFAHPLLEHLVSPLLMIKEPLVVVHHVFPDSLIELLFSLVRVRLRLYVLF